MKYWDILRDVAHLDIYRFFGFATAQKRLTSNRDDPYRAALRQWWEGGGTRARQQFDAALEKWDRAKGKKDGQTVLFSTDSILYRDGFVTTLAPKETPAGKAYRELYELGAPVLPFLMERIEAGDVELLPAFQKITLGQFPPPTMQNGEQRIADARKWWEANRAQWLIPWPDTPNEPPK